MQKRLCKHKAIFENKVFKSSALNMPALTKAFLVEISHGIIQDDDKKEREKAQPCFAPEFKEKGLFYSTGTVQFELFL